MGDAESRRRFMLLAAGDSRQREALFVGHVFLVSGETNFFPSLRDGFGEDLFQAGCVGLWEAIDEFSYARDIPFTAYSRRWVRNSMSNFVYHWFKRERFPLSFDLLEDRAQPEPEEAEDDSHLRKELDTRMKTLDVHLQSVVMWRAGLGDEGPMTFKAIGDRFGVTKERAGQMYKQAVAELRTGVKHTAKGNIRQRPDKSLV